MNKRDYQTSGTCSEKIQFNIIDGKLSDVEFIGGCEGNSLGISKLVEGMEINEVISRLRGIDCDGKGTSCPDQLAHALENYINEN